MERNPNPETPQTTLDHKNDIRRQKMGRGRRIGEITDWMKAVAAKPSIDGLPFTPTEMESLGRND